MPLPGEEPVAADEIIYRRVRLELYTPVNRNRPQMAAFRPNEHDTTGLSVVRAKYKTPVQAAQNSRSKQYYVAFLRVSELRARGIEVVPKPLHAGDARHPEHDPGHAELPQITYSHRRDQHVMELMELLASALCFDVQGPYP